MLQGAYLTLVFDVYFCAILQGDLQGFERKGAGRRQTAMKRDQALNAIEFSAENPQARHQSLASLLTPQI